MLNERFCTFEIDLAVDDKCVQEVLLSDDMLDVLEEIGYSGVTYKETKSSASDIIQCKEGCHCRLTASTCDLALKLPIHIGNMQELALMMTSAINDCVGFALV